jgi:hypothetical protein
MHYVVRELQGESNSCPSQLPIAMNPTLTAETVVYRDIGLGDQLEPKGLSLWSKLAQPLKGTQTFRRNWGYTSTEIQST